MNKMEQAQLEAANLLYKASNFLALPIEKNFVPDRFIKFTHDYWPIPILCVIFYMAFCYFGSKVMKEKAPFDLRLTLAAWNAFLSLFSFIGMLRTVPYLLASILSKPYESTICSTPYETYGVGPVGFWVMLFIFSKIPELIDTVFIVLRKKPLIFLHWYHHVTVLLYCWHAFALASGTGLYFVAMNYSVHAVMYGYYCLQALQCLPKSFPAILITAAQIAQMFVGTGVCISSWYFLLSGKECHNDVSNLVAGAAMYGSYLYLFCDFAFGRYFRSRGGKDKTKSVKLD
jgi:hypothetical protein